MALRKRYWWLLPVVVIALVLLWLRDASSGRIAILDPWEPPSALPETVAPAPRVACARTTPEKRAFFGDLHVHTALSYDAYGYGTPALPEDAYRFATGQPTALATTTDGQPDQLRIDRPLDFAAVADHAEWLADASLCTEPGSPPYDSWYCRGFRREGRFNALRYLFAARLGDRRSPALCGEDNALCRAATLSAWQRSQRATEGSSR